MKIKVGTLLMMNPEWLGGAEDGLWIVTAPSKENPHSMDIVNITTGETGWDEIKYLSNVRYTILWKPK